MIPLLNKTLTPLGVSKGGLFYLWQALFGTAQGAPMPSSLAVDIGLLKKNADSNNQVNIANGKLDFAGNAVSNFADPSYYGTDVLGTGFVRANGRAFLFAFEVKTNTARPVYIGLSNSVTPTSATNMGIYFVSGGTIGAISPAGAGQGAAVGTWTIGSYTFVVLEFSDGFALFGKGGALGSSWLLLWVDHTTSSSPLYPAFQGVSAFDYEVDRAVLVAGLGGIFSGDYSLAVLDTQSFSSSLGSELLTNGDFASGLTDWALTHSPPDPEATVVGSGEGHGGAGTGSINFYSTATDVRPILTQAGVLTPGIIEIQVNASFMGEDRIQVQTESNVIGDVLVTGTKKILARAKSTGSFLLFGRTPPTDATLDSASAKLLTLDVASEVVADGVFDFSFTLPVSPVAGEEAHLCYRIQDSDDSLFDCWDAYVRRNDANNAWDFRLDSIAAGSRTNRIATAGIGTPDTIRVIASGNLHDCYTKAAATWTKRGTQVNNSTHAAETGVQPIYSSTVTPTRLTVYPRTSNDYAALDNV